MRVITVLFSSAWQTLRRSRLASTLCLLVAVKLIVMFALLRACFFTPALSGMSDEEKQSAVATQLMGATPTR